MRNLRPLLLASSLIGVLAPFCAQAIPVRIAIENLAPANGNFLTPFWVGFHNGGFDLYDLGSPASPGLERLAEDGNTGVLSAEFAASGAGVTDATLAGPGGAIAPGEAATMTFDLDGSLPSSRYFSYASMVIPSNDAFIANGNPLAHAIFDASGDFLGADFLVAGAAVLDAGTEVNDEIPENVAFLGQTVPNTGTTESGTVQIHPGFSPAGNILSAFPGADFTAPGYQVARISITRIPEPGVLALVGLGLVSLLMARKRR
ncbi:MAG: spondin domain-containing protein [Halioglobus sp.]|nr:spondin domain-containing protein [Halioglobus sp.]